MSRSWLDLRPALHIAVGNRAQAQVRWLGRSLAAWELPASQAVADLAGLVDVIEQLLVAMPAPRNKLLQPCRIHLVLPDNLARLQWLPWTPALVEAEELRQFAIERFEMADMSVRAGWTVHAQWRRFESGTLAYAVPNTLIDALQALFEARGLRLASVVPASATAHYRRLGLVRRNEVYLVHGGASISALRYERGCLVEQLSEACRGDSGLKRILARLALSCDVATIQHWHLSGIDAVALQPILGEASTASVLALNLCSKGFA